MDGISVAESVIKSQSVTQFYFFLVVYDNDSMIFSMSLLVVWEWVFTYCNRGCMMNVKPSYAVWLLAYRSPKQTEQRLFVIQSSLIWTRMPSHHEMCCGDRWRTALSHCNHRLWMVNEHRRWPLLRHRLRNDIPCPHCHSRPQATLNHRLIQKVLVVLLSAVNFRSGTYFCLYGSNINWKWIQFLCCVALWNVFVCIKRKIL